MAARAPESVEFEIRVEFIVFVEAADHATEVIHFAFGSRGDGAASRVAGGSDLRSSLHVNTSLICS